jgi:hypothetical protein
MAFDPNQNIYKIPESCAASATRLTASSRHKPAFTARSTVTSKGKPNSKTIENLEIRKNPQLPLQDKNRTTKTDTNNSPGGTQTLVNEAYRCI